MQPYIANTDHAWFDFLTPLAKGTGGRIDEVNFWSPKSTRPMKRMEPGTPIFFRLKAPRSCIAGYGFFAHFQAVDLDLVWDLFGWKNGDPDKLGFFGRIGRYRKLDLLDPSTPRQPLGCTMIRDAHFWPQHRWLPWKKEMGWAPQTQQGNTERDPARTDLLVSEIQRDAQQVPEDFADSFVLQDADERRLVLAQAHQREGQGSFRARLLDAYGGRCAITGERTRPVLDAAHIQPYLGPASNHVQNGLILTKEFHALFDRGYVAVTPDYKVRVSPRLHADWNNGKRYYDYDGKELKVVPDEPGLQPSPTALVWHQQHNFLRAS